MDIMLMCQPLIDKGANANSEAAGKFIGIALQVTAGHGHEVIMKLLIDKGGKCECRGKVVHRKDVGLLIDKGVDVNALGHYRTAP
ncbi:hypothetical protein EV426DRAFT_585161 [Tirmania nivea]|nr:hypothetical protein EV426DRAFT_585161 [Tirmania nivea]